MSSRSARPPTARLDIDHLEQRASPPCESAAEDRQLLGRIERDRHHHRRRTGFTRAAPPRRAVLLGLRDGGTVRVDRHGRQGRCVPVSTQVHRRPRHPGCARRQARVASQSRAVRARGRDRPVRQPRRSHLPPGPDRPRGGWYAGDRRVDPRGPRVRAEGGDRERGDPPPRARPGGTRAGVLEREPQHRDSRQHDHPSTSRSSRWACAGRRGCCTRISS